jgi:hypothetical protein
MYKRSGSSQTLIDTGIPGISTDKRLFEIFSTASTNTVVFKIDGVTRATVTSGLPDFDVGSMKFQAYVLSTASIDKLEVYKLEVFTLD